MRGCSAFCKCYTSRSWLENKKPFLYSLKKRHVIISNKIIIICRPANCAASLSHNREVPVKSPSLYLFPPPQKKKNQEKAPKPVSKTGNGIGFFFFFANDGSSVCVKESERQRERGSTLISSIMTHGGGGGHLFANPTSKQAPCQRRVMHIFPSFFPCSRSERRS